MATVSKSGKLTRTSGSVKEFPWTVQVSQGTQNTANNTTVLNFTATVKSNTTSTAWDLNANYPQLAIYYYHVTGKNAGTTSTVATATYGKMSAGETKTLEGTLTVTHNNSGQASGYAYATWTKNNSSGYVPNDANTSSTRLQTATLTLTTIARAATVSWNASSYTISTTGTGTAATFSYTADTTNFDYTESVKVGTKSVTPSSKSLTKNQILGAMSNVTTAEMTVTLTTKLKGTSTVVGTSTATATVTIDTTAIKPAVTITLQSPSASNVYAGYSSIVIRTSATNSQGATASSLTTKVTANGLTFTPASQTSTGNKDFTSSKIPAITNNDPYITYGITATVTDSRGATNSAVLNVNAYKWTAPKINSFNAYRVASSGSSTADGGGAYVYVSYSTSKFSSGGSVTCTSSGGETITNGGTFALATNATRKLTLTVTDALGVSATQTKTIPTAKLPLDLYDNGSGSVGCGIGAVASGDLLKVGFTTYIGSGKATYNDGVAGIGLHSNGNLTQTSASTAIIQSFYSSGAVEPTARITASTMFYFYTGSDMEDSAMYLTAGKTLIVKTHIYSGGRTAYNDTAHAGVMLGSTGNIYLGTITSDRPSVNFYVNKATTATASITAYEGDTAYGSTSGAGNPRLQVAGALNATKGIFWNGHRAVMDYETGSTGHVIQLRWNSPNLEVYVDGSKVKTL